MTDVDHLIFNSFDQMITVSLRVSPGCNKGVMQL